MKCTCHPVDKDHTCGNEAELVLVIGDGQYRWADAGQPPKILVCSGCLKNIHKDFLPENQPAFRMFTIEYLQRVTRSLAEA